MRAPEVVRGLALVECSFQVPEFDLPKQRIAKICPLSISET